MSNIWQVKNKTNPSDIEVVGIKPTPRLVQRSITSGSLSTSRLTQTTSFYSSGDWYTLGANQCRIKLTNGTGVATWLTDVAIRGQIVYRLSGAQGWTHDHFSNYEDILLNGEEIFKLQNNYICNLTQVNQLADYHWKFFSTKKHIYKITLHGTRHWYKLGLWYTLQIGGAGEAEYIDSTVKLIGKSVEQSPNSLGKTVLTFVEVEENWKFDSSYVARYISAGIPLRTANGGNVITVASSDFCGLADYYCDGTADQTEINNAIQALKDSYGGGTVHLTRGQFNITAAIELDSNIVLEGEGAETVIEKNCNDYAIECVGSSGNEKEKVIVQNLGVTRNAADTNIIFSIYCSYTNYIKLNNIYFYDLYGGCRFTNTNYYIVDTCNFVEVTGYNIYYDSANLSGIIRNNIFEGNSVYKTKQIYIIYSASSGRGGTINVINNVLQNIYSTVDLSGIVARGTGDKVINNTISNLRLTKWNAITRPGIQIYSNSIVSNNNIYNIYCANDLYAIGILSYLAYNNIVNNYCEDCLSRGVAILGLQNTVSNNYTINNDTLINYGHCENATNPPKTDGNLATNTSAARSDVQKYEGDYSYKITKSNAAGTGASYWFVDNNTTTDMHGTVIKQGSYRLGLWVYVPSTGGPAAAEVSIYISEYDGGWNDLTDVATTQDAWEYLEAEVNLDSDTTGFRCGIAFADTAAQNEYIYIDNVRLTPMGVANEHDNNFYDDGIDTIIG